MNHGEEKLTSALNAILAGIITNLLYDIFSESSYQIVLEEESAKVVSNPYVPPIVTFMLVILFYLLLLYLITIWLPPIISHFQNRALHRPTVHTIEGFTQEYREIKNEALSLSINLQNMANTSEAQKNMILSSIPLLISKLYCMVCDFKSRNNRLEDVISSAVSRHPYDCTVPKNEFCILLDLLEYLSEPKNINIEMSDTLPLYQELNQARDQVKELKETISKVK